MKKRTPKAWCNHKRNLEKGLIFSLLITISVFVLSKRISLQHSFGSKIAIPAIIVEDIPKTRQGIPQKPPERPTIPIPVESDVIPEDAVIEPTDPNFNLDFGHPPEQSGAGSAEPDIQPRPIAEVFPEYPEEDLKKGVEGFVKLFLQVDKKGSVVKTVVLDNTTGSKRCADAASEAALKSRFFPARKNNKAVVAWITKIYTFSAAK